MSDPRTEPQVPHGPDGIELVGPRDYVGGLWDELGQLQFDHLRAQGLAPGHVLYDVGCGCLRGGVHFVPHLEPGGYCGIDKEALLIDAGLRELSLELREVKRPRLLVSASFEFERFGVAADYALAQSLFTHLTPPLIEACLSRLRPCMSPGGLFCASFFEWPEPVENRTEPHDWGFFAYTRDEMIEMGERSGWRANYIGDWGHPREQKMMHFHADDGAGST